MRPALLVFGLVVLLSACSTTVSMYPVKGPLLEQRPAPVVLATVDGILGNTGGFYLTLPNGDKCKPSINHALAHGAEVDARSAVYVPPSSMFQGSSAS